MFHNIFQKERKNIIYNPVIKGTIILIITGLLTRLIGFYNRIFLSDLIGATELGIYQLIFPIYLLVFSITICGNELALTKLVSEFYTNQNRQIIKQFFHVCFIISLISGLFFSILLYYNAAFISNYILKVPECKKCLQILSFGIPCMAMKGSIHGFFLGKKISSVHGISDLIEQIMKVLSLYILSSYVICKTNYSASFAVIGIVISEYISFFYSIICYTKEVRHEKALSKYSISYKKIFNIFIKNAIPMTTNKFALTLVQSIEAIIIPASLLRFYHNATTSLSIYGVLTGISFPFIMFPATITNALSTMIMPAVSSAYSEKNNTYLRKLVENSIHFCFVIGLFASVAFFIFGKDIGLYVFDNRESGIYLFQLSFLCPLIYLSTTMASILNGLGLATQNLMQTLVATGIRILFILFAIPKIGVAGYILGLFASYLFLTYACSYRLSKKISYHISILHSIFYPVILSIIEGSVYYFIYKKSITLSHNNIANIVILLIIILLYCITTIGSMLLSTYKNLRQHH